MKVAIVIGHGPNKDKGAVNIENGKIVATELDYNRELASLIKVNLHSGVEGVIVNRVIERLQPVKETNATGAKLAIELHLNSYDEDRDGEGDASGTEMIVSGSQKGREFAQYLQKAAVTVLGLPDRGIKLPQGGGRGKRWLTETNMPAVIVESFFIDNDHDLLVGCNKKNALAKAYADAIVTAISR